MLVAMLPYLIPLISMVLTDGLKWVAGRFGQELPAELKIVIASGAGAGMAAGMPELGMDPAMGAVLGLGGTGIHQIKSSLEARGVSAAGAVKAVAMILVPMMLLVGCSASSKANVQKDVAAVKQNVVTVGQDIAVAVLKACQATPAGLMAVNLISQSVTDPGLKNNLALASSGLTVFNNTICPAVLAAASAKAAP